jgi:hypothetical protein
VIREEIRQPGNLAMTEKPSDWDDAYEWPFNRHRRVCLKILGNPNPILQALGLEITLPDPDSLDEESAKPWHGNWKDQFRGRVVDRCDVNDDADWLLLLAPEWGRIWFDIEEGISIYCQEENMGRALDLLSMLSGTGVPMHFPNGDPRVSIRRVATLAPLAAETVSQIEAAGFVQDRIQFIWVLRAPESC